jgi:hypothetical protein
MLLIANQRLKTGCIEFSVRQFRGFYKVKQRNFHRKFMMIDTRFQRKIMA